MKPMPVIEVEDSEMIPARDVPSYPNYDSLQTGAYGASVKKG